ncbi:MAG TPA: di-heme oxidoredictase family protein [Polyangiaceae bacterium]|nr:di-heme oxidoredictase family protein [Polyangiaceae bacterium]
MSPNRFGQAFGFSGVLIGAAVTVLQACSGDSRVAPPSSLPGSGQPGVSGAPSVTMGGPPSSGGAAGQPSSSGGLASVGGAGIAGSSWGGSTGQARGGAGGSATTTDPTPLEPDTCGQGLAATFTTTCAACHTAQGVAHPRYPDLYQFKGTLQDFRGRVREGSQAGMPAFSADMVSDAELQSIFDYFTRNARSSSPAPAGGVIPLFESADALNPPVVFERPDGVLVTRGAGRVRGRHEGPLDSNEPFMEFVADYFKSRTYGWIVEDFTRMGQSKIRVTYLPISMPTTGTNFRAWKDYGNGDVFSANMGMTSGAPFPSLLLGNSDLAVSYAEKIAPYAQVQQQETTRNSRSGEAIRAGDLFEFEFGIFIEAGAIEPTGSRTSYYTDTFRYRVGQGGITPDNADRYTEGKGVLGPVEAAQQGGGTTNVWAYFRPETQFGQMALNIQHENVQHFVEGRRLFHTDFQTGKHSESGNPDFTEQRAKAGPLGTATSCETCHKNNGPGQTLEGALGSTSSMAIKLYGESAAGRQLQLTDGSATASAGEKKTVTLADGTSAVLSRPKIAVLMGDGRVPAFSARIARKVIGLGLLESVDENTILVRADRTDCNGDGISGRPNLVHDPRTNELRIGRFGWKAEKVSLEHQNAEALHDDMGVGTSIFPDSGKTELSNEELDRLVTYMRLVSVPGQRSRDDTQVKAGEQLFRTVGCAHCHVTDLVTGVNHPFAELRGQSIKPYTDLLLHDMGPDLADDSKRPASDDASAPPAASEWRTPPLWGTGMLAAINGHTGLLHDGRAANILEAILWHGGEGEAARERVKKLSASDREALIRFVMSL